MFRYLNLNFDLNFKVMNLKYFDFTSKYKYLNFDLDLSYEFLIYVENFTNRHLIDLKRFFRRRLEKDFFLMKFGGNSSTPHFTTITILPNIDEFSKNLMFL